MLPAARMLAFERLVNATDGRGVLRVFVVGVDDQHAMEFETDTGTRLNVANAR